MTVTTGLKVPWTGSRGICSHLLGATNLFTITIFLQQNAIQLA